MSTIVVVRKDGYAAIAADTMTKFGGVYESAAYIKNSSKMVKLGESYAATVGHASLGLVLASVYDKASTKPALDSTRAIFDFSRELHAVMKEEYFLNPVEDSDDSFESSQMRCLIANSSGIFGLYAQRSVLEYTMFYSFGSGSEFALGAMRAVYHSDLDAEAIARIAIEAAADFDDGTGLPLEIYKIKLDA